MFLFEAGLQTKKLQDFKRSWFFELFGPLGGVGPWVRVRRRGSGRLEHLKTKKHSFGVLFARPPQTESTN